MKIRSEEQNFTTSRSFVFMGKEGEEGGGTIEITIKATGITTPKMTDKLDALARMAERKAKRIVEEEEAPRQIFR